MKKKWKIVLGILSILALVAAGFINTPVDIRPPYLKRGASEADYAKGQQLMEAMQNAYGGKDHWLAQQTGSFAQEADWYEDKLGVAGWDTTLQQFQMTSVLGTDNSELTLLNGPCKGQPWGVQDGKTYQKNTDNQQIFLPNDQYQHKLIFKNYWFQFPFRISEAPIVVYAGEATVDGETYDLLFASWGSETPNRDYDQYVLYLDQETRQLEWLHFTLRDIFKFMHTTAHFTDFRSVNGVVVPFNQYVTSWSPEGKRPKFHENRYQWRQFGKERVER